MTEVKWTDQQKQAIEQTNSNILVAAAAGSGKTAVLVERIINKVINEKIDIDKMLVVTFTNAAASEMRQKILEAIYKKIDENPKDINLQRQITLLNKASISTIHAFCLDVIRNNFFEIDASANFRIGDTAEIELLKQEVLEELFEEKYEAYEPNFLELIHTYTSYRNDDELKNLILTIYTYMQSMPFPEKWLEEQIEKFDIKDEMQDFAQTIWGEILLQEFESTVEESKIKLQSVQKKLLRFMPETEKFVNIISSDINNIENLQKAIEKKKWNLICENANLKFDKWPVDKKCTIDYKEEAKQIRDVVKKTIKNQTEKIFIYNSQEAIKDIKAMYKNLKNLQKMLLDFNEKFAKSKRERNIIDFNDIEHFALKILVKEENGKIVKSPVAEKITEKYSEIAIDEYQDSNMVQEYILNSISNGKNIFMVGDVKQSIYRFRQACPELFLDKYESYKLTKNLKENYEPGVKIQLFKNFRSRKEILDVTNLVFESIMSKQLGDIDYNEEEYLNLGANYQEIDNKSIAGKAQLHIIDLAEEKNDFDSITITQDSNIEKDENTEIKKSTEDTKDTKNTENTEYIKNIANIESIENIENSEEQEKEIVENTLIEARFVAKKIREIVQAGYMVYDTKKQEYRKIKYKDIVILLRSTSNTAPIYEQELQEQELPVFSDTSTQYLNSVEIQTIMSILKILDNPLQDIPLVTVMRSPIGNFTDNDLVEIRLADKTKSFYNAMVKARISVREELREKIDTFLNLIESWKKQDEYQTLDELIWQIYSDTNYYNYVGLLPNGGLKQANLKMLFEKAKQYEEASFKGLFQFINFIERLSNNSGDMQAAKIIGENEDVIRIMSIHKSKGLEFPVVFLCGTSKKFNMQDLNETILMHSQVGFGPKYIDYEKRIEYDTLAKEAIKIKLKNESISEEMRVLYVALTRAKEKLFITGVSKDLKKELEDKQAIIQIYENNTEKYENVQEKNVMENGLNEKKYKITADNKMNVNIVKKAKSYLDWLEFVYLKTQDSLEEKEKCMQIFKHKYNEETSNLKKEESPNILEELNKIEIKEDIQKQIEKTLNWKYKYEEATALPTKTSVTNLKEMQNEQNKSKKQQVQQEKSWQEIEFSKPKFIENKEEKITSARKGTLTHLAIQKMNEKEEYTQEKIEKMLQDLVDREIILEQEAKAINIQKLIEYTKTDLWKELQQAQKICKEQPFYISIPLNKVYNIEAELEDEILVQGIIDLYYINKDGEVVLVDYKTDFVEIGKEMELIEKYRTQLELYKEALESALEKKVTKVEIYSVYLNKEIIMEG